MLGNDGRLYDPHFDHDKDGKLNTYERAMYDDSFNNDASGNFSNPARMNGGLSTMRAILAVIGGLVLEAVIFMVLGIEVEDVPTVLLILLWLVCDVIMMSIIARFT